MWYDRQGKLLAAHADDPNWLDDMQKVEKLLKDPNYKIVQQDYTPGKRYWVSTVWLGIDNNWGRGKPVIFETMVFNGRYNRWHKWGKRRVYFRGDYDQVRYSTEKQALAGHKKLLKEYTELEKNK